MNDHSIRIEMRTIGAGTWGGKEYKLAVHGPNCKHDDEPSFHIYWYDEVDMANPRFDISISLLDILTKDEINIVSLIDKDSTMEFKDKTEGSWSGYEEVLMGIKEFLFSKPLSRKESCLIDNLEKAIVGWNKERLFNYEAIGRNPLRELIENKQLKILPKFLKYF